MFSSKPYLMHNAPATISSHAEQAPARVEAGRARRILGREGFQGSLRAASDMMAISAAHRLADFLASAWLGWKPADLSVLGNYLFFGPLFAVTVYLRGGYKNPGVRRPETELERVTKAVTFYFAALACAGLLFVKSQGLFPELLLSWYVLALGLTLAARFSVRGMYVSLWKRGWARQRVLFIGSRERWEEFQSHLALQRFAGYELAALVNAAPRERGRRRDDSEVPIVSSAGELEEIAERCGAGTLLVCWPPEGCAEEADLITMARACQQKGIAVEMYSGLFAPGDLEYDRNEFSGGLRFAGRPAGSRALQRAAQKSLSFVFGAVGSLLTLLVTPVVALLLKWEDGGPVFYRREFVDCDGQTRHYLKFRTMVQDADQLLRTDGALKQRFDARYKLERDPRVLRVGRLLRKYSIDEFPQFFSVLTGRLALVGPRVISQEETERYQERLPRLLSVKPGLTGYWQVMGRQTTTYEERIQMDMFYIEHWSIWLDLIIIGKTFWKVLRAEGAY